MMQRRWGWVALSAVLQVVVFPVAGTLPAWRAQLAWIAMAPLLLALLSGERGTEDRGSLRDAALLGYGCGMAWYLGTCYWVYSTMHLYGGLNVPTSILVMLLFCMYLGLYHALFATLVWLARGRLNVGQTIAATPFLWVAVELARARVTGFPWNLLGTSVVDGTWARVLAPVGGVMLLSFLVMVANAAVVAVWISRSAKFIPLVAGLLVALAAGGMTVAPKTPTGSETAVLLQPNLGVGSDAGPRTNDPLPDAVRLTDTAQARAITLWPESPAPYETDDALLRQQWIAIANHTGAPVIAGALGVDYTQDGRKIYNSAAVVDPQSGYVGRYDKIHLVPFGEFVPFESVFSFASGLTQEVGHFQRGTSRTVFHAGGHAWGVFLCYESIFGDEVRQFVKSGAQVLVNLSDDGWYGDTSAPFQHLNMARMRAIENARWVLRDTNTGVTGAIDPQGTVHDTIPRHVLGEATVHFDFAEGTTFYTRHGDWFAWVCTALTLSLLVWSFPVRMK